MAVSACTDDPLGTDDAVALGEMVRAGQVSAAELLEAAIARAEAVNPDLNAVAVWDLDRARTKASSATGDGVFAGVPTFYKGVSNYEGLPNRFGSRAVPDTPATDMSPGLEQLGSTGVVPLGLTTSPEFGLTATTENSLTGVTRNPWSLEHSSGGSSGGSAAMVAAGVVPIAHANDGGGSIRIPASCCGLVGLKSTRDRMLGDPLPGIFPINPGVEGMVSRTVRDTAAYLHAAEQFHPAPNLPPVGHVTEPIADRLRVGVILEGSDGVAYDSAVTAEVHRVAALLEDLGHQVEIVPNPFDTSVTDDFLMVWCLLPFLAWHGGKRVFGKDFDREQMQPFAKHLKDHFRRNLHTTRGAFKRVKQFAADFPKIYADHDVLLAPTLGGPCHRIGYLDPELPGEVQIERSRRQVPTTWHHNAGGGPAISLPLATDATGLPMGMHFSANMGQEATLLALALELEQAHPWPTLAEDGPTR